MTHKTWNDKQWDMYAQEQREAAEKQAAKEAKIRQMVLDRLKLYKLPKEPKAQDSQD
jgi:hypothetical protein